MQVSWTRKDIITYALGVGAKRDELSLVYGMSLGHAGTKNICKLNNFTELGTQYTVPPLTVHSYKASRRQVVGPAANLPCGSGIEGYDLSYS